LPFDQFETIDIPFNWTGAPMHSETGVHCQPVAAEVAAEAAQLRRTGGLHIRNPLFELTRAPLADKDHKSLRQSSTYGELTAPATQVV
jgi:hypothetical protein